MAVRLGDMYRNDFRQRIEQIAAAKTRMLSCLGEKPSELKFDAAEIYEQYRVYARRMKPYVGDTTAFLLTAAEADRRIPVASLLHKVLPPQAGIASDIAKEGVEELGYPRFSVTSLATMTDLWKVTRRGLGDVHAPVLLLRSTQDHVVDGATAKVLTKRIRGLEQVPLTRSFHVATLDHDADLIAETSRRFVTRHA